jgi:hypothetical protein
MLFLDPITREALQDPVLASDGVTYSFETLVAAMAADPHHRSPVTREVLRPVAFRNPLANTLRGLPPGSGPGEVVLWPSETPRARPPDVFVQTVTLPTAPTPALAAALVRVRLDDVHACPGALVAITAEFTVDGTGTRWLMHPPPPEEAWNTCAALAHAVYGRGTFANPWCIAGAEVAVHMTTPVGCTRASVESFWAGTAS